MRITNNMLMRDMMWNVNRNLNTMSKSNKQLQTGNRVFRPSDDPVGITQILKYRTDLRVIAQYKNSIEAAGGHMDVTESALQSIKEMVHRIEDLSVKAANGVLSKSDSEKVAEEVEQIKAEILVAGNSTNGGKYIFSGLETDKKLFNKDGSYNVAMTTERVANKKAMEHEIAIGEVMKTGTHPVDIFGVVDEENPLSPLIPAGHVKAAEGTRAEVNMNIAEIDRDFSGGTIEITVDGQTYTADTSLLDRDYTRPMTKERLINVIGLSETGTTRLEDVANIFFDTNDRLVIRHKKQGTTSTISASISSAHITDVQTTGAGTDNVPAVYSGAGNLTDAQVAAEQGTHGMHFARGRKSTVLNIDFSTINTVSELGDLIQNHLDTEYPPAGTMTVTATDGSPLQISVSGGELSVDTIRGTKSQMIEDLNDLITKMKAGDHEGVNKMIDIVRGHNDKVLSALGEVGAKTNRLKFIKERNKDSTLSVTEMMTKIENIDYAEAIIRFKSMENVYRASLSVGSKVVQPSLLDFIR